MITKIIVGVILMLIGNLILEAFKDDITAGFEDLIGIVFIVFGVLTIIFNF